MKNTQFGAALLFIWLFINSLAAQPPPPSPTPTVSPKPSPEIPDEMRDKAVALLKQTAREAMTSSLPENRAAFSLEIANLLWRHDEAAARGVYENAMADVLTVLEGVRQTALKSEDETEETGERAPYMTIQAAKGLRSTLILKLAERDPNLALAFFRSSHDVLFAPTPDGAEPTQFYQMLANSDEEAHLETRLAAAVSEQDPERAFALAQARLAKGVTGQIVELIVKLHGKDPKRGAKLAGEMLKKLGGEKLDSNYQARAAAFELLTRGAASLEESQQPAGAAKTPILAQSEMRDLAEMLIKAGMSRNAGYESYDFQQHLELMSKYAPVAAEQLKRRLTPPTSAAAIETPATDARTAEQIKAEERAVKREEQRRQAADQQQRDFENLQTRAANPGSEKITLDDVERQLGKFKKREERLMALTQIAAALSARGDRETAKKLLDNARSKLVAEPKFYTDLLAHLIVARGYVAVDPAQSLEILENLVYRLNETVGALVKLGEFAAGDEAIQNGELRFGGFGQMFFGMFAGGEGGMFGNRIGEFQPDLIKLAAADLDRLTAVANKFERPELRLLARMLVLESLLKERPVPDAAPATKATPATVLSEGVRD